MLHHLPDCSAAIAMRRLLLPATTALASVTLFSCYPYQERGPGPQQGPGQSLTSEEQQKIEEQRKRMKEAQEKAEREQALLTQGNVAPTLPPGGGAGGATTPPPAKPEKKDYPFATSVPGKEGFVFSPYNNKVIDVRDMPSGTLVQDPTYPAAEKKYFRVP